MVEAKGIVAEKLPACPSCSRACMPGTTWAGANYCRGAILLAIIDKKPGLTGWQLAQVSGLAYPRAVSGLAKLREYQAVRTEAEEREAGGFRYRYHPAEDPTGRERFLAALPHAEALR
jgi:hypothetical protein